MRRWDEIFRLLAVKKDPLPLIDADPAALVSANDPGPLEEQLFSFNFVAASQAGDTSNASMSFENARLLDEEKQPVATAFNPGISVTASGKKQIFGVPLNAEITLSDENRDSAFVDGGLGVGKLITGPFFPNAPTLRPDVQPQETITLDFDREVTLDLITLNNRDQVPIFLRSGTFEVSVDGGEFQSFAIKHFLGEVAGLVGSSFTFRSSDQSFFIGQIFFKALAPVPPIPDVVAFSGFEDDGRVGSAVTALGDINGDGFVDLGFGARLADPDGQVDAGSFYVVFGSENGFESINFSSLDGSNGFAIEGGAAGDRLGFDAAALSDIDGDGDDDFAVTMFGASGGAGAVLIVLGDPPDRATTNPGDLSDDGEALVVGGVDGSRLGFSIDSAGDVDGDGTDDLIIGAPGEGGTGAVHLVFGGEGFAERAAALSGDGVVTFRGARDGEEAGYSVATLGDVNGDGLDDFAIGAPSLFVDGGSGAVYVVFGDNDRFDGSDFDLSSLDGSNGFVFTAGGLNDFLGRSVSSAGDVNGDGFDDILVSAPFAKFSGQAHLIYGREGGFAASFGPRDFELGEGATFTGERFADEFGWPAVAAGDVNGDGFDDLLFGAHLADGQAGEAGYVDLVFGGADPFAVRASVDDADGYRLEGVLENDFLGVGLASVGDINGDGYDDYLTGAPGADPNGVAEAGLTYLVYGSPDAIAPDLPLADDFA